MSIELYEGELLADSTDITIRIRVTKHLVQAIATARLIGRKSFEYKALPDIGNVRKYYTFLLAGNYIVRASYLGEPDKPSSHHDWIIKIQDYHLK